MGLDSIIRMLTPLKIKFPRILYREPLTWGTSKVTVTLDAFFS